MAITDPYCSVEEFKQRTDQAANGDVVTTEVAA